MDKLSSGGRSWYPTTTGADLSVIQGDATHHLAEVRHPGIGALTLSMSSVGASIPLAAVFDGIGDGPSVGA